MDDPASKVVYVSRGGEKLAAALDAFGVDVTGAVCADLGSNVGGFVDCLLRRGAARVYAIDTGYGVLAYRLRQDPRVVVRERTNAMHVQLPERVDLATVDAGWTRQRHILPNTLALLKPAGRIITLIKPHYEADRRRLQRGVLPEAELEEVINATRSDITALGIEIAGCIDSPLRGQKGNHEFLMLLRTST